MNFTNQANTDLTPVVLHVDEESHGVLLSLGIIEPAIGRKPISSSSSRLLVVTSHRLGHSPVSNKPVHSTTRYHFI